MKCKKVIGVERWSGKKKGVGEGGFIKLCSLAFRSSL